MKLSATAANLLWCVNCQPARRRLERALENPAAAQAAVLQRLLSQGAGTVFAREHGLRPGMTAAEFQKAVPVRNYDEFLPWIERTMNGEPDILFAGKPLAFERSSGSTAAAKFIPFTAALRMEFQEAVRAWMGDLFSTHPAMARGPAWWVISPLRQRETKTTGGIPVGLTDDSEYLGSWERRLARRLWAVPPEIAGLDDLDECLDWTLRFLLQEPDLRLISVWNPSFLTLLWRRFEQRADELLHVLRNGTGPHHAPQLTRFLRAMPRRAKALRREPWPRTVWPRLAVISGWADGEAANDAAQAARLFSHAAFQPKGLLATEGVVTIPWGDFSAAGVPALHSHFLEFGDDDGAVRLAHELEEGREYTVLLTTGGGLWRYRSGDRVRVEGRAGASPRLRFAGRCDDVCDLRGEKLSGGFAAAALRNLTTGFRMLAPCREASPPYYILFAVNPPAAADVEPALLANPHYAFARAAGQLGKVRVFRITETDPVAVYLRRCAEEGRRAGTVKAAVLHHADGWEHWFEGKFTADSE